MASPKPSSEAKTSYEEDDQQEKSRSSEKKSSAVKPQPAASSSSSSSSSESETESDSEAADQPISSKQAVREPKRTKKRGHGAVGDDETRSAESSGKSALFQRLRSDDDEIALLNGGETELTKSNEKILKKRSNTDRNVSSSLIISEMIRFDENPSLYGLGEDYIRRGVELIGPSKRAEMEDMWKELRDEEFELFVKRSKAYAYEASLIREAMKSSN